MCVHIILYYILYTDDIVLMKQNYIINLSHYTVVDCPLPCENGGTCIGGGECDCASGWWGATCERG